MHQNATCRPGRAAPRQESAALDACPELARDWALFEAVETGEADHLYRCWETARPAVVAGRHRLLPADVHEDACRADDVPVLRRASGGGTVVLAAGCLNYAVALSLVSRPELLDVEYSFAVILDAVVAAVDIPGMERAGTDLSLGGRKVSGNAQRRGRRALLHQGTLLYDFDATLAERYLKEPLRQPAYRAGRRHTAFMANLPMPSDRLRVRLESGLASLG